MRWPGRSPRHRGVEAATRSQWRHEHGVSRLPSRKIVDDVVDGLDGIDPRIDDVGDVELNWLLIVLRLGLLYAVVTLVHLHDRGVDRWRRGSRRRGLRGRGMVD